MVRSRHKLASKSPSSVCRSQGRTWVKARRSSRTNKMIHGYCRASPKKASRSPGKKKTPEKYRSCGCKKTSKCTCCLVKPSRSPGKKKTPEKYRGCKKTSKCACERVKCLVKPSRCVGYTKCK